MSGLHSYYTLLEKKVSKLGFHTDAIYEPFFGSKRNLFVNSSLKIYFFFIVWRTIFSHYKEPFFVIETLYRLNYLLNGHKVIIQKKYLHITWLT